jgi:hypothetical protein
MATATYKYARSNAALAIAGSSQNWTTPENIYAGDGNDATTAAGLTSGQYTNYLIALDFGFTLPDDAIVQGIQVRTEKEGTHVDDKSLRLTLDGGVTLIGTDLADKTTAWPDADLKVIQGSTSHGWGLALWGLDVNSSKFGYAIACVADATGDTPAVDGMEIQLTYTDLTETIIMPSALRKGRDIYKELDLFMKDKHTAKRMVITFERCFWKVARISTDLR